MGCLSVTSTGCVCVSPHVHLRLTGSPWRGCTLQRWQKYVLTFLFQRTRRDFRRNVLNIRRWIDSRTGKRSDVPHHYIYNRDLPNLDILSGHHVKRVLFTYVPPTSPLLSLDFLLFVFILISSSRRNGRASGVEYVPNARFHPSAENSNPPLVAHARRLVVLSAGALGTPAILERSGIGARDVLARVGITEPVVALPGVGENYQGACASSCVPKRT